MEGHTTKKCHLLTTPSVEAEGHRLPLRVSIPSDCDGEQSSAGIRTDGRRGCCRLHTSHPSTNRCCECAGGLVDATDGDESSQHHLRGNITGGWRRRRRRRRGWRGWRRRWQTRRRRGQWGIHTQNNWIQDAAMVIATLQNKRLVERHDVAPVIKTERHSLATLVEVDCELVKRLGRIGANGRQTAGRLHPPHLTADGCHKRAGCLDFAIFYNGSDHRHEVQEAGRVNRPVDCLQLS